MIAYSFTGLTAELFAEARRKKVPLHTPGPQSGEIWVLLNKAWRVAPRAAMPLLIGVTEIEDAERVAGGTLRALTRDEIDDAEMLMYRASREGGGRCR